MSKDLVRFKLKFCKASQQEKLMKNLVLIAVSDCIFITATDNLTFSVSNARYGLITSQQVAESAGLTSSGQIILQRYSSQKQVHVMYVEDITLLQDIILYIPAMKMGYFINITYEVDN